MQQQGVITKVLPLGEGEKDGFPVIHITTVSENLKSNIFSSLSDAAL